MAKSLTFKSITPEDFTACLNRYDDAVSDTLRELDQYRFTTIPAQLKKRRDAKGGAWLAKEEVQKLVEWKLKHGTFRPSLTKLVASNSDEDVESITKTAFNTTNQSHQDMIKQLAKLRGIGPATAALLASCYDPDNIPFFSDELFRWLHWDGKHWDPYDQKTNLKKPGKGWSRQIGYTMKEYESLAVKCEDLQNRMASVHRSVDCLEIEKAAYVLGKEETDIGEEEVDHEEESDKEAQKIKRKAPAKVKSSQPSASTARKRKASIPDAPDTITRRTRSKKID